mgnify:CR=1 FL=1
MGSPNHLAEEEADMLSTTERKILELTGAPGRAWYQCRNRRCRAFGRYVAVGVEYAVTGVSPDCRRCGEAMREERGAER